MKLLNIPFSLIPLWKRLRRITTSGNYIPEIDGLRFVAIIWVFLHHINDSLWAYIPFLEDHDKCWLEKLAQEGDCAVPFFFMISGCVLALPFLKASLYQGPKVSLKAYYIRRLTRLEPPYIVAACLFFLICVLDHSIHPLVGNLKHFLAVVTYTHGFFYQDFNPFNRSFWSLEIEVQFYLIVPLLIKIFDLSWPKRHVLLLTAITGGILFSVSKNDPHYQTIYFSLADYIQYFLCGFVLAELYLAKVCSPLQRWTWLADVMGALAITVFWQFLNAYPRHIHAMLPFLMLIFAISVFQGKIWRTLLTHPLITTLGGMCYSIYLLHQPLIAEFVRHFHQWEPQAHFSCYSTAFLAMLAVCLVPIFGISILFYTYIERPCMDKQWPQKLWLRAQKLLELLFSFRKKKKPLD